MCARMHTVFVVFLLFLLMFDAVVYCTRYDCCCRRRCHVIAMSPVGLSPTSLSLQFRSRFVIDTTSSDVFLSLPSIWQL